ncbi:GNAT family N-acetyltransferase [Cytobacillus firmus]|uniref:GNAT family N-acetyltransferase n=1 Tax=Cytobacillus firmus TaxID=1399 RepID=UPI0030024AC7
MYESSSEDGRGLSMAAPVIKTDRLILRKMKRTDLSHLIEIFSDPEAMRFYRSTKTKEQAEDWISWTLRNYRTYGTGLWIAEEKASGRFLGQCGITPQDTGGVTEMEIGYLFARREWGKGYATEAALACKEYGFTSLNYSKLVSIINVHNLASICVAEKAGMKKEKTLHRAGNKMYVYSISKG